MTPEQFIEWIAPAAQLICKKYGIFPSVCIAQAAIESGWGRYTIGEYNLFGRKAVEGDRYIEVPTQEYIDGEYVRIMDKFKDYSSLEEAIEDYCILITEEPVYAPCLEHLDNVADYVHALAPIYATDPQYASMIGATIYANDLEKYDREA